MSMKNYNKDLVLAAWKQTVNTGVVDESRLRPEIARSWRRCLDAGLSPWSVYMAPQDMELLQNMREKYSRALEAFNPILQYLIAVFNCNVSVANTQAFVFELLTPLSSYPRTLGTYIREEVCGNGNITIALHENKPYRVDGYEHFRAFSQSYSGVAAPVRDMCGDNFVLCMNNPFCLLPENALDCCVSAAELACKLSRTRRETFMHLSTANFFDPLIQSDSLIVVVTDTEGNILTANNAAKAYLPGYEKQAYGTVSLSKYLKEKADLSYIMEGNFNNIDRCIEFKGASRSGGDSLNAVRSRKVELVNGMTHVILVFETSTEAKSTGEGETLAVLPNYVGESDEWKKVDSLVKSVAPYNANVMIMGDTGTGKEVVAQALHRLSGRKGAFVAINCGGIPRELLSSELFGYEGGAFTGANAAGSMGKFEFANGGTLFLDEIGDMPVDMQVSLLRVIQEQCITRVGGNKSIPVDVRIVAATNQDVEKLISLGRFRSDLWYRLSVIEIHMPKLCERRGDVALLANFFNEQLSQKLCIKRYPLSPEVISLLDGYSWPGNVRELRNVMEKALIIANGMPLSKEHLPDQIVKYSAPVLSAETPRLAESNEDINTLSSPKSMREKKEREKIISVLQEERGNISRSAKRLNMSRNTLYRKIEKMDIHMQIRAIEEKKQ